MVFQEDYQAEMPLDHLTIKVVATAQCLWKRSIAIPSHPSFAIDHQMPCLTTSANTLQNRGSLPYKEYDFCFGMQTFIL
jgi:hypothetical protein